MPIFGERPGTELAIAAAHGDHAQFALERYESFEYQTNGIGLRTERRPRGIDIVRRLDPELALAVVT